MGWGSADVPSDKFSDKKKKEVTKWKGVGHNRSRGGCCICRNRSRKRGPYSIDSSLGFIIFEQVAP